MKKIMFIAALFVLTAVGVFAPRQTAQAAVVPECSVATAGTQNSANHPNSKFQIANNIASVKYNVTGENGCKVTVAAKSYYTLKQGGLPREEQVKYKTTTETVGVGTHTVSVELPPAGCYYQVDFVRVIPNLQAGQKNEMLGYQLNGDRSCIDKDIRVCVLATKTITTVKLSEFYANSTKYSRDLSKCPTAPGDKQVCELDTGNVITIKENQIDADLYSTNVNDPACKEVLGDDDEALPEAIASTGPVQALVGLMGTGSITASAAYYLQSRRNRR